MPICRICGCKFKICSSSGKEICGNDECWEKAWNRAVGNGAAGEGSKPRRIPEEVKRRIIELYGASKTRKEIATMEKLPYATVSYIIRNAKCDSIAKVGD